ncbi:MAG: amino acid ABC transporter substrate-binding protein [Peptococcus niger]
MKKKSIVAMLLMAAFALTACGGGGGAATSEQGSTPAQTSNGKTLIVGFDQSFPPMGFKDSKGEFTGFDIELAKLTAEKMGYDISLQPIDWDSKDAELDTGNINCIWNGFTMTGREDKYTFSKPYMQNRQILVVKKDSDIASLADLKGKTIELQQGSTAENALNDNKDFKDSLGTVTMVPENMTALTDLEQGSCDAVLMDEVVARYNIAQGREFKVLDEAMSEEEYAVGFKLGNEELAEKVNAALDELAKDGKLKELSEKYFKEDITLIGK